jgi:CheY-like chemotaxis protein
MNNAGAASSTDAVLVVESNAMVRLAIAGYLRDCGYHVIEAASAKEVMAVLNATLEIAVQIVFSAVESNGSMDGFRLARWVRDHRSGLEVVLTGTVVKAAHEAADLCEEGPHLERPYEPQQVVEWIKKLRNLKPG